jgi:hypothetical protein
MSNNNLNELNEQQLREYLTQYLQQREHGGGNPGPNAAGFASSLAAQQPGADSANALLRYFQTAASGNGGAAAMPHQAAGGLENQHQAQLLEAAKVNLGQQILDSVERLKAINPALANQAVLQDLAMRPGQQEVGLPPQVSTS